MPMCGASTYTQPVDRSTRSSKPSIAARRHVLPRLVLHQRRQRQAGADAAVHHHARIGRQLPDGWLNRQERSSACHAAGAEGSQDDRRVLRKAAAPRRRRARVDVSPTSPVQQLYDHNLYDASRSTRIITAGASGAATGSAPTPTSSARKSSATRAAIPTSMAWRQACR